MSDTMDIATWLATKYPINVKASCPIEIPNVNRDTLARWMYLWDFTVGAEIGVERGLYSEVLCRENPGLHLFCVDAWRAYRGYRDHVSQEKLECSYEEARERLAPHRATIIRKFSLEAVRDFKDASLDFVYIDANHGLRHCIDDIAEWSKKVRPGGVIAGHDYARYKLPNQIQVVQAVNAWTDANEIRPWYLLGTQAKIEGELRDTARSWMWVHNPKGWPPGKVLKQ